MPQRPLCYWPSPPIQNCLLLYVFESSVQARLGVLRVRHPQGPLEDNLYQALTLEGFFVCLVGFLFFIFCFLGFFFACPVNREERRTIPIMTPKLGYVAGQAFVSVGPGVHSNEGVTSISPPTFQYPTTFIQGQISIQLNMDRKQGPRDIP